METIRYTAALAGLLVCNGLIANALSWVLTEWKRPVFNFKPFNCRPCLSFWLTLACGFWLVPCYGFDDTVRGAIVVVLVLVGLFNYIIIKSKIQIHE